LAARVIGGLSSSELETALTETAPALDPADQLSQHQMTRKLERALETLTEREQHVVRRFFFDELAMRAIGEELGVTESRISQIVTAAVTRLRAAMNAPAPVISLASRKKRPSGNVASTRMKEAA
jgi:RNA polymerase sigma factor (sigma-70 family)